MHRLFASYLAEDSAPIVKVTGEYDPEQQLWIGDSLPLASNGTEDGGGGTVSGTFWFPTGTGDIQHLDSDGGWLDHNAD